MGLPTVSVVILAYNGERYLAQIIQSVQAQTISTWELVIVGDGSADGTPGVAQSYAARDARIRVVRQANGGVASARNRGIEEMDPSSEYVIFLDHDDVRWPARAPVASLRRSDGHPLPRPRYRPAHYRTVR